MTKPAIDRAIEACDRAIRLARQLLDDEADTCQCDACRAGPRHYSDCAVHRPPAEPAGPCDCGGVT